MPVRRGRRGRGMPPRGACRGLTGMAKRRCEMGERNQQITPETAPVGPGPAPDMGPTTQRYGGRRGRGRRRRF